MHTKPAALLAGAMLIATLAGCGSSGDDGGADAPIKVMVTATLSSPTISNGGAEDGAKAAAAAINAAGGVNGRDIEVIACNDGLDPNKAAACVQKGIDEHVVAFVGGLNFFTPALWPKVNAANIPWIGLGGVSIDQATEPLSYPVSPGNPAVFRAAGRVAVEKGGKKVVVIRPDTDAGKYVGDDVEVGVKSAGGKVEGTVLSPLGAPDTSSAAAHVIAMKPDAVSCACDIGDTSRLLKSLRQAGFEGAFTGSYEAIPDSDLPSLSGLTDNTFLIRAVAMADDPKAAAFKDEMAAHNESATPDGVSAPAWLATHYVADLLSGADDVSPQTLIHALNTAPNLDSRGVTGGETTFTKPGPMEGLPRAVNTMILVTTLSDDGGRQALTGEFEEALGAS